MLHLEGKNFFKLFFMITLVVFTAFGCSKPRREIEKEPEKKDKTEVETRGEEAAEEDPNDFSQNKEKYSKMPADNYGHITIDKKLEGLLSEELSEQVSPAGIFVHDDKIVLSDMHNNRLLELDMEGNLIREVGKLGNGPLEFSKPGRLYWNEKEQLLYVSDLDNGRVQRLDQELNYVDEFDYGSFESGIAIDMGKYAGFPTVAVDKNGRTYIATRLYSQGMYVYELKDGQAQPISDRPMIGTLYESEGNVFFFEYGCIDTDDIHDPNASFTVLDGPNSLYQIEEGKLKFVCELPLKYTPSDMLKIGDDYFFASEVWALVDKFKIEDENLNYVETLTPAMIGTDSHIERFISLDYKDGYLYIASASEGQVYKIELK